MAFPLAAIKAFNFGDIIGHYIFGEFVASKVKKNVHLPFVVFLTQHFPPSCSFAMGLEEISPALHRICPEQHKMFQEFGTNE